MSYRRIINPIQHKTQKYGASIYDVCTEEGGGVPSKADIVRNLSKGGCVNLRTRGEGGQKIRKICGCHIWTPRPPYSAIDMETDGSVTH